MSDDQAAALRRRQRARSEAGTPRILAIASGKGGTGKSNVAANLAIGAARDGARAVLVDADLGLANADLLLGLAPERGAADVLRGSCPLAQALCAGPGGVEFLAAGDGVDGLRELSGEGSEQLVSLLRSELPGRELVVLDCGAGISDHVIRLAAASDEVLVVMTAEPTSLVDAYAFCKRVLTRREAAALRIVVNGVRRPREGRLVFERLRALVGRFLGARVELLSILPHDPRIWRAVAEQSPLILSDPRAPLSLALRELAGTLRADMRSRAGSRVGPAAATPL